MIDHFLFVELAADALTDGRAFDGVAFGKFTDMLGREIELKAGDAGQYVTNTKAAIDATRTESGELVGLPIDAQGHDKGDGAGWIVGVELVEGVIRFLPKWTEIGRELIGKGIRRFFSATIDISNKVVLGGTLTNWPATRDAQNRVMLRPIELEGGLFTAELLDEEPGELQTAPIAKPEEAQMAEDVEVLEDQGVTIVTADPPAPAASYPAEVTADLMSEFSKAGRREPADLALMVQERAQKLAQSRVSEMLETREREWQIAELAAKYTGGSKYGLPVTLVELTDFLASLNAQQFKVAEALFDRVTKNGLVEFQEVGHGRRLLRQQVPQEYHATLRAAIAAGNSIREYFELSGLGDPNKYDLSQFEGGK